MPFRVLVLICISLRHYYCLSCEDVLNAHEDKVWPLDQLETMTPKEIVNCVAHLSKMPLPEAEAKFLWKSIQNNYDGMANIPDDTMMQLRWIITVIEPADYEYLTLDNVDVIAAFGDDYNLNPKQMAAIADRIREDWGGKIPKDYTDNDLIALQQILCAFTKREIDGIHPEAYKEAASALGKLKSCPIHVLQGLASLATNEKAFGDTSKWTANTVSVVGVIVDGLPVEMRRKIPK